MSYCLCHKKGLTPAFHNSPTEQTLTTLERNVVVALKLEIPRHRRSGGQKERLGS